MSKKISDLFKLQQSNQAEVKQEKEVSFTISFHELKVESSQVKVEDFNKTLKLKKEKNNKTAKSTNRNEIKSKTCNFCGKEFSSANNLREHLKKFHWDKFKNLLNCSLCNLKFQKESFLNSHIRNKHQNGQQQQFECDFDAKIFKSKSELSSHMKTHLESVKCEICSKMLKFGAIKNHIKNFHASDDKFQCLICSKTFKTTLYLSNHVKTHNKKFQCEICNKLYPSKSELNKHKKQYHENLLSFECETCGKKFKLKTNLKTHQKTHDKNRPKPFKCQQCDYATDLMTQLKSHHKFHERQNQKYATMKNPLKCTKCPTLHRSQTFLNRHMKSVHPKVSFQCDLCARYFKVKSSLRNHMKVHIQKNQ